MAPGTGIWTEQLVKIGDQVTALDASPEMIAINQAKLASDKVTFIETDLFAWQPQQQYDMVFFASGSHMCRATSYRPFCERCIKR